MQFFMHLLRQQKLEEQRQDGIILYTTPIKQAKSNSESLVDLLSTKKAGNEKGSAEHSLLETAVDGYWVTINDWTACSLKCGGGVSTLQRACVPPKNGGKTCKGTAINNKVCNVKPCPDIKNTNTT